jgi:hypothetical protein
MLPSNLSRRNCLQLMSAGSAVLLNARRLSAQQNKPNPAFASVDDIPGLPRVLLIGDSISIGYTLDVRDILQGEANVHRPPTNCGPTEKGLQELDAWLGSKSWDVIHFNWGLHDLKYVDGKSGLVDVGQGKRTNTLAGYGNNLEALVVRLKKTGATLIWTATTPIPKGSKGRIPGDEVQYNVAAKDIMKKHGVAIDDLYTYSDMYVRALQREANVHYMPEGSRLLAEQVVKAIRSAL